MAFDELKKDLTDSQQSAEEYLKSTSDYFQLKIFRFLMKAIIALTLVLALGTLSFLLLFFVSLAASVAIGESMGSETAGFMVVGLIYLVLAIVTFLFRKKLEAPVLRTFSKYYFEDE